MRHILVVTTASDPNIRTLDFACFFARLTHSRLVPALVGLGPDVFEAEPSAVSTSGRTSGVGTDFLHHPSELLLSNQRRLLDDACSNRGVALKYLQDDGFSLVQLIKESRFADLIIVDANVSFQDTLEGIPTGFIKQLIEKCECPVIVAPESSDGIEEILFAYDGSQSSMFAIRQFAYLFPELTNRPLTVLQAVENIEQGFTDKEKLIQWLENYFTDVKFELLLGRPKDELFGYFLEKENKIAVMGSYGRNALSLLFSKSNAELILKAVNLPVFISHA